MSDAVGRTVRQGGYPKLLPAEVAKWIHFRNAKVGFCNYSDFLHKMQEFQPIKAIKK